MKLRSRMVVSVFVFSLLLLSIPANADPLYDNGGFNGTLNAWTINYGFSVTDSFTLQNDSTVSSAQIGLWLTSGDTPSTVDWLITSAPFGGTTYGSGTANLSVNSSTPSSAFTGFDLDLASFELKDTSLLAGTYYFQLLNATSANGLQVYWDENDGSSIAFSNTDGQIGSETFNLQGQATASEVPEPTSLSLLGTGLAGFGAFARRKIKPNRSIAYWKA